jgi:hypothetical protein
MPLGNQFRNTYFTDDEGTTHNFSDPRTHVPNMRGVAEGTIAPDSPRFRAPAIHTDASEYGTSVPHQGMLFSPYTGTGLKEDPLVHPDTRRAEAERAYNLRTPEDVMQNSTRAQKPAGSKKNAGVMRDLMVNTVVGSGIPHHILKQINTGMSVHKSLPGRASGDYYYDRKQIRVLNTPTSTFIPARREITMSGGEAGAPIMNPNFSKMVNKKEWFSDEGAHADMAAHATFANEKGEHYRMTGNSNPRELQREGSGVDPNHFTELPAGHSANVWEGAGKDTDKYVTKTFKVYNGYNAYNNRDNYRTFHTRHERVGAGTPVETIIPASVTGTPSIHPETVVHETGHHLDKVFNTPSIHYRNPDPVYEGVAEGFKDRHHTHAYDYETSLTDAATRSADILNTPSGEHAGYTLRNWGNKLDKATHIAVRAHVASSDNAINEIPDRRRMVNSIANSWNLDNKDKEAHANSLMLGHLYSTHAHVRSVVDNMGFTDVARKAVEHYQSDNSDYTRHLRGQGPKLDYYADNQQRAREGRRPSGPIRGEQLGLF